jgi:alpha-L-rhamnosidase
MKTYKLTGLLAWILISLMVSGCQKSSLVVVDLRTENLTNPVNIDIQSPCLSWKIEASAPDLRDLSQKSWQVLVASSRELLKKDSADMWNSGIMDSSDVTRIIYSGKKLNDRQQYYWKVRAGDKDHKFSAWSLIATFKMALLSKNDWNGAKWIGLREDTRSSPLASRPFQNFTMNQPVLKTSHPSPLFRKQFVVSGDVRSAMAYISGLGYTELYVNGEKSGDNVLDPGQTNYDVRSFYVTHDITGKLKKGENVIGVMLGNGFYGQNIAFADWLEYGSPRMICKIWIEYRNGKVDSLYTGGDWKAATGPVMFDNVYGGEFYDARQEKTGWNKTGYDDSSWQEAMVVEAPNDSLRSQLIPPIKRMKTVRPVRIFPAADQKWIIDLGQNIAGWAKIRIKETPGELIKMRFAENLDADGKELDFASLGHQHTGMIQTNIYVCKSKEWEEWEPRFTFAGFRYIEVTGLTRKPDEGTIQGILVHSSVERTGHFLSSDTLLNRIYETSLWTIVDNLHSIPEDCPAREKCGWLGDAHGTAETDLFNFDMALFYTKYMADIKSQLGRGGETYLGEPATPGIPGNISTGKRICQEARVDWGVAVVLIPYFLYLYDGDIRVFRDFYPNMKDFIAYVLKYEDKNGIIQNGYGDWCPPGANEKMECPPELTSTAFFYRTLAILTDMAGIIGDPDYASWCRQKMKQVRDNFNKAYLRQIPGTDHWTYGSQTGIVIAYRMGLIPEDKLAPVTEGLLYDIRELHKGHISTGIHGQRIYSVLCDMGHDDIAYDIFSIPTFPSLAYTISSGQTTWPETPMEYKDKSVKRDGSFNHPMNSGFAAFFHECAGGIRPLPDAPGFKHFEVKPHLINQLRWVNTDLESPYGKIASNWKSDKNEFTLEVLVPCNTTATIYVPSESPDKVSENSLPVSKIPGVTLLRQENGRTVLNAGSGEYHFRVDMKK